MAEAQREVVDLREHRDDVLLDELYRKLFLPNFPDPDEHEDPRDWAPRLWGDRGSTEPVLHALVAGAELASPQRRVVMGFLLCEFYESSACGLLSYLAIDDRFRQQGLARELFERGIQALTDEAESTARALRAVFGEIHDPEKFPASQDSFDPAARLEVMKKLGAHLVPISYVQPALGPGLSRSDRLLLVTFPINGEDVGSIDAEIVQDFLQELYVALGVENPELDPDYQRMREELGVL